MHKIISMDFQTSRDLQKQENESLKKEVGPGRQIWARPAQSGGLPGARLAKSIRRHPIQIRRRAGLLLRATAHADTRTPLGLGFGQGDAHRGAPAVGGGWFGGREDQKEVWDQERRMHRLQRSRWCPGRRDKLRQRVAMATAMTWPGPNSGVSEI
jgi:hypothetical protein